MVLSSETNGENAPNHSMLSRSESQPKLIPRLSLGITIPDMPNLITFIGPTWPVENGSVMGPLGKVAEYTIKVIKKMQSEFIRSIVPKQDMTDLFNAHTQEFIKQTVWSSDCRSWYRSKFLTLPRALN